MSRGPRISRALGILGYGCVTAAGQGASALFDALATGRDCSTRASTADWPVSPAQPARVCQVPRTAATAADRLALLLDDAWQEAAGAAGAPPAPEALGLLFASTKGCVEDYIWRAATAGADAYTPVIEAFLARSGLRPQRYATISNACSSVHVALQLASLWLQAGVVRQVLVLGGDLIGPFVVDGFASLKSLAPDRVTPFAADRQGIQLGDAATALLVVPATDATAARLTAVDTRAEGYALTRSREGGDTLKAACRQVLGHRMPDAVIAHGTGTTANDAMEDHVYRQLCPHAEVTCTKWSVGHALGASGGVDLIAGLESLRRRRLFAIGNTEAADPSFGARYLTRGNGGARPDLRRLLVASAGFGGMHGAALLEGEGP